ncbi:hypothetical protein [Thalassotalea crassostreae]|uniref:hypothetical protein n=1 Tax=Thalassotalea crassostreae TaxID=1763536 RepID=UPI000837F86B|nr:hypothetical protein [Thalassotalea crassostreae]
MKLYKIVLFLAFCLTGCSASLDVNELESVGNSKPIELRENELYAMTFTVNKVNYYYASYHVKPYDKYLEILWENEKVVSVSELTTRKEATVPELTSCTHFPFNPGIDVDSCLTNKTKNIKKSNSAHWQESISDNGHYKSKHTPNILDIYIGIPLVVIASPFILHDDYSIRKARENFPLTLSKNNNLRKFLDELPEERVSEVENKGTAYIGKGLLYKVPSIAFGYEGENIQWIAYSPKWTCSPIVFRGATCEIVSNKES